MCNSINSNSIVLYCCCLQCVSEGRRVEESSYPHTYNPNMALVSTVQYVTSFPVHSLHEGEGLYM